MTQASLWQPEKVSADYAELCNALYERELLTVASQQQVDPVRLQSKLKSLPHYVKRTALLMSDTVTPLTLDPQNASWVAPQGVKPPLTGQKFAWQWYEDLELPLGLIVPVMFNGQVHLDAIDRLDNNRQRLRTNAFGWMSVANCGADNSVVTNHDQPHLMKPMKKIMMAACAGHRWQLGKRTRPQPLTLRELLLSCHINWRNFRQTRRIG